MSQVYVLNKQDWKSTPMNRIHCKSEDSELQAALEWNHDLLPGEQIDPDAPRNWILIKREMLVPNPGTATDCWSLDFLFADQDAIPTLVECKRFDNTQSRREVIGQVIEYAANGQHYWGKEQLQQLAQLAAEQKELTLEEAVHKLGNDDFSSPDEFFSALKNNLDAGKMRLIFFLEESSFELRSAVKFLNELMPTCDVLIVEARQYELDDSRIVVPTLFGYSDKARIEKVREVLATIKEQSSRTLWDEDTFFQSIDSRLGPQATPIKRLYQTLKDGHASLDWGKGGNGTFNIRFPDFDPHSAMTVYVTGWIVVNLWNLPPAFRPVLKETVQNALQVQFRADLKFPSYSVAQWGDSAQALAEALLCMPEKLAALPTCADPQP